MKIKHRSNFKNERADFAFFEDLVVRLEENNKRKYERYEVETSLGKTHVWRLHSKEQYSDTLVIFPGARTSTLIWDLDNGLDNFNHKMRIFLVETNGLPNLSDGATPDIKTADYGYWAAELFEKLGIENAFVAGASFGGLICMKLGIVSPDKIKAAFLLNPGGLQPFSLTGKNLYFNLLPIIRPSERNVLTFLNNAVFSKPNHSLTAVAEKWLVDYQVFAISRYKDRTQKPYYMDAELSEVTVETYLLEGDRDILFPYQQSIENARKHLRLLKEVKVFANVGHGIETCPAALNYIGNIIKNHC